DRAVRGGDTEGGGRREEGVGGWLPGQAGLLRDDAVDAHLEEVLDTGGGQHRLAVLAGGDDRPAEAGVADRFDEPYRPLEDIDPIAFDQFEHEVVLAR